MNSVNRSLNARTSLVFFVVLLTFALNAFSGEVGGHKFPDGPDLRKTPGDTCKNSTTYRYPEHIMYCDRSVDTSTKNRIIAEYDKEFGYGIRQLPRGDFKIDHLVPLSVGGANTAENLWPQHKSVYKYSDPLESDLANLIAAAKITQKEAIRVIVECKTNLGRCEELGAYLKSLYKN